MLYFILPVIGFLTGILGTLIGAGGGFVLMPVLLLMFQNMTVEEVTMISMIVIFFNALSGTVAYSRMKRIDYRTGMIFSAATIPGSIIGTFATTIIPRNTFNVFFGIFLILISIFLVVLKKQYQADEEGRAGRFIRKCEITDSKGKSFRYSYNCITGIVISIFTGFISPILGIGGGIIHVPAMIRILCFPAHIATATSHFTLMIMSLISVITHLFFMRETIVFLYAGLLSAGVLFGAQIGAHLSSKIKEKHIIIILSIALCIAGLRIIFLNR